MISVEEALGVLRRATAALGTEGTPLSQALGRVLARDVVSDVDWPPFDTSAMDGYAVRRGDLVAGRPLPERIPRVAAGDPPPLPLAPGEAVRVMTGAPIPPGTEAIVPVEKTRSAQGRVVFEEIPPPGSHIRRRAESIAAGQTLLRAGRRVSAGDVALAALAGSDPIEVFRRPRVTVVATGNELVPTRDKPSAGKLRDSNGPMLVGLCRARGWAAQSAARVEDEAAAVERLFADAGPGEDVLVTSGGVSAGDFDLLPDAARRQGFETLFHGVSVRPGKPILVARRGETLWFGLPGNPVSTAIGFHLFLRFALDRLEGSATPGAPRLAARLTRDLKPAGPRETYRDALVTSSDGVLVAEPIATRGSHDIAAHAQSNALIRQTAGSAAIAAGALVECVLIGDIAWPAFFRE